jgi:aminodeoxyfutalosine deaminase
VLLLADWVVPVSSAPLADAGVRVAEGRIVEVGPAAQLRARSEGEEVRSFPGCALLPGFVNSHSHLELSAFRGFARPSGFGRWMLNFLLARRKLDRADFEASALWGAYECARCGVTSLADTAYDGRAVAGAAGLAGLRARVYQEFFGLDDATLPRTMERYEALIGRLQEEAVAAGPLVEVGVSPHAPYTVSARLYREAARFARRAGLRLATHVAESQAEVELLERGTGSIAKAHRLAQMWTGTPWSPPRVRPIEYVAATGLLGPDTLVIHAVQVNREEVDVLAASGAPVAHCPRSNARLRCGVAPIAEFLAAGVPVGLGTDSLASNDSLDMFAEMRAALAASETRAALAASETRAAQAAGERGAGAAGPPALTAEGVLRMATVEGARALGWERLTGSLEPGKSADVIAVGLPAAGPRADGPLSSSGATGLMSTLVIRGKAEDVRMTMAAGRVVFDGGSPPAEVLSGYRTARQKLGLKG